MSPARHASFLDFKVKCVLYERSAGMAEDVGKAVSICYNDNVAWNGGKVTGWNTHKIEWFYDLIHGAESASYAGRAAGMVFWVIKDV